MISSLGKLTQRSTTTFIKSLIPSIISPSSLVYPKRFYEVEASELKRGDYIEYKGKLVEVLKIQHQKVAMRGGFILADCKGVFDNSKCNYKMRSAENVEFVEIDLLSYTYAGKRKEGSQTVYRFRDLALGEPEEHEEGEEGEEGEEEEEEGIVEVSNPEYLSGYAKYFDYLPADSKYGFREYDGKVFDFRGPLEVTLKINDCSFTGSSTGNAVATLENGSSVKVPHHIKAGDTIVVRLPDEVYVTKA
eukprot:gene591-737_t